MKHRIKTISKASVAVCAVLLFASFVAVASARPDYQFYTIDESGASWIFVFGINNSRMFSRVYGVQNGDAYTDLFWNGQRTPVVYPGSSITLMGEVNNSGFVFGNVGDSNHQHAAVLELATGTWTLLPDVIGPDGTRPINIGNHMNDQGIGAGISCEGDMVSGTNNCIGWIWDGKAYSFPTVPGSMKNDWEGPSGINDRGDVVGTFDDNSGTHAFLLADSAFTSIDMPGFDFTQGFAINNRGEILLTATDSSGNGHIGIWYKGVFTPLPSPQGAGSTFAYGLNDHGDYCGYYVDADGNMHGFVAFRK